MQNNDCKNKSENNIPDDYSGAEFTMKILVLHKSDKTAI